MLLQELSNNEDNISDSPSGVLEDPNQPWYQHFLLYTNAI